jgi:hypothetical protein
LVNYQIDDICPVAIGAAAEHQARVQARVQARQSVEFFDGKGIVMSELEWKSTACVICSNNCGLEVKVEGSRVFKRGIFDVR